MSETFAQSTVKKFDIFSLPFQFSLGQEKEKKTFIGGLLSLLILSLSVAYLAYLCYLYFGNLIQPTIASTNLYSPLTFPMEVSSTFISIKVTLPNGQSLQEYQAQQGKVYLLMASAYDTNGRQAQLNPIPMIDCQDSSLDGYMCLNMPAMNKGADDVVLNYTPNNVDKEALSLLFAVCLQAYAPSSVTCEDPLIIRQTLISLQTKINIRIKLRQFNTQTKRFEDRIKEESYYLDTNIAFYSKFILQKTDSQVSEGFVIQSTAQDTYFSDMTRQDASVTQSYIQSQLKLSLLGGIIVYIGEENISLIIQYAQFTTLLAQFSSVFNSLLFLGIISKFFAQSEILQQFAELQLKVYFKKSALLILEDIGQGEQIKQANEKGVYGIWNYIQNLDVKKISKHIKLSLFKKIKLMITEDARREKEDSDQIKVYKQLLRQSTKALNIFEIQRELLKMKLMLRLLLSVEQYAAIQLCGSKLLIPPEKPSHKENEEQNEQNNGERVDNDQMEMKDISESAKIKSQEALSFSSPKKQHSRQISSVFPLSAQSAVRIQQQNTAKDIQENQNPIVEIEEEKTIDQRMSHLEMIDLIDKDNDLFKSYLDKFLQKQVHTSELDQRIKECMISVDNSLNDSSRP